MCIFILDIKIRNMHRRPNAQESEEDLLKLQQQFLSSEASCSAKVKKPDKRKTENDRNERDIIQMEGLETTAPIPAIPSKKCKVRFCDDSSQEKTFASSGNNNEDLEEMMDNQDRGLAAVLTNIIERDTRNEIYSAPVGGKQPFPAAVIMDLPVKSETQSGCLQPRPKKKSLFAQQVEAHSAKYFGVEPVPLKPSIRNPVVTGDIKFQQLKKTGLPGPCFNFGAGLSASKSDVESEKIHEENVEKLSTMAEEEILEEQKKLLQMLDPKIVEFMRAKRKAKEEQMKGERDKASRDQTFSVKKENKKHQKQNSAENDPPVELPFKPRQSWLNMSTVEKEKLEWMKDLPAPSSMSTETGRPARFDFQGNLLAVDADMPVNLGLHHHGDEPEAKSGFFCGKIESPIIPSILAGGVVILLRWALDDSVPLAVTAGVNALHALLFNPLDEEAKDLIWPHFHGHVLPSLTPTATLEKDSQPEEMDEENKEEETDADMIKRDVILALVTRMELLTRFHYLLSKMQLPPETIIQMLEILQRISQHSSKLAYEIFKCPGLMEKIVQEFLPTAWSLLDIGKPLSSVHGVPLPAAVRLVRVMCQSGRNLASILASKFHLNIVLLRYLAVSARELQLPKMESVNLQTEALGLWRVLAAYGQSVEIYFDLYNSIVPLIGKLEVKWHSAALDDMDAVKYEVGLISVLEKLVCLAGASQSNVEFSPDSPQRNSIPNLSVNRSHVASLHHPLLNLTCFLLNDIGSNYPVKKQNLTMATVCLNFLSTFYETEAKQSGIDEISRLDAIKEFCNSSLVAFLSSFGLSVIINNLCGSSNILAEGSVRSLETAPNLPTLGVHKVAADDDQQLFASNVPTLRPHSPFGFLVALLRLLLSLSRRHKDMIAVLLQPITQNKDILVYVKKTVSSSKSHLCSSHFTMPENLFHFFWLKCCILRPCLEMDVAHRAALALLSRLHFGDEHLAHDLLSTVIFSPSFISEGEDVQLTSQALTNLKLSETLHLKSATQEDINVSQSRLLQETYKSLNLIRAHYLMAFGSMEKAARSSRNVYLGNCPDVLSLLVRNPDESLMPKDWVFMPLIQIYNSISQRGPLEDKNLPSQTIAKVTSVLQWTYLLEILRPLEMDRMSVALRLSRIFCAFIAGTDLFLEKPVHQYLAGLIRVLSSQMLLDKMDLDEKIPGITSFYDLYQEFLDHYEAVSFGDPVFGLFVLLPLQQKHSPLLRRAIWEERRKMLRTLRVPLEEMLIPVQNFLYPEETDHRLLQLYSTALATNAVFPTWSPMMYLMAVHHLNRFLYTSQDDGNHSLRQNLWKQILASRDKVSDVIYYKQYNPDCKHGLELYDQLPENRQKLLDSQMHAAFVRPSA
ncbi:RNA polymerase II associated protein 1 [Bulinus truncatus]|nr:RNA polymerase II associated protein 1 [Bulinus truncatus]